MIPENSHLWFQAEKKYNKNFLVRWILTHHSGQTKTSYQRKSPRAEAGAEGWEVVEGEGNGQGATVLMGQHWKHVISAAYNQLRPGSCGLERGLSTGVENALMNTWLGLCDGRSDLH